MNSHPSLSCIHPLDAPGITDTAISSDYLFGYGSIINDFSRLATLLISEVSGLETSCIDNYHTAGSLVDDAAVAAMLSPEFGYTRSWCYRVATGFTALGLRPTPTRASSHQESIFGVLFPVTAASLALFDSREMG